MGDGCCGGKKDKQHPEAKPVADDQGEEAESPQVVLTSKAAKAHHVSMFAARGVESLVVRRGSPFTLTNAKVKILRFKGKGGHEAEFAIEAAKDGKFTVPMTRPVGRFEVSDQDGKSLGTANIIFNPWSSKSSVHYAKDTKSMLESYVLKEEGYYYYGSYNRWGGSEWQ
eukprot:g5237.t1